MYFVEIRNHINLIDIILYMYEVMLLSQDVYII